MGHFCGEQSTIRNSRNTALMCELPAMEELQAPDPYAGLLPGAFDESKACQLVKP